LSSRNLSRLPENLSISKSSFRIAYSTGDVNPSASFLTAKWNRVTGSYFMALLSKSTTICNYFLESRKYSNYVQIKRNGLRTSLKKLNDDLVRSTISDANIEYLDVLAELKQTTDRGPRYSSSFRPSAKHWIRNE